MVANYVKCDSKIKKKTTTIKNMNSTQKIFFLLRYTKWVLITVHVVCMLFLLFILYLIY